MEDKIKITVVKWSDAAMGLIGVLLLLLAIALVLALAWLVFMSPDPVVCPAPQFVYP